MPRELAIMACTECKRRNYTTTRNKRTQVNRLEIKKFCPAEKKHTVHRETK
jgi:large subunit ribosomal protein L33